jgi:hypothetical protein
VQKYFRVQYDSLKGNHFLMSMLNKTTFTFRPTAKGLYTYDKKAGADQQEWTFITTVKKQMERYTKHEYNGAVHARCMQNIMMHLGVHEYLNIVDKNLIQNMPVTHDDIRAAEDIFGPNLGSLKGKTVNRPIVPVTGKIDGVPLKIKMKYQSVTLAMDIMFVNKIPFLFTVSHGLHFGTAENLPNHQVQTIKVALKLLSHSMLIVDSRFEA